MKRLLTLNLKQILENDMGSTTPQSYVGSISKQKNVLEIEDIKPKIISENEEEQPQEVQQEVQPQEEQQQEPQEVQQQEQEPDTNPYTDPYQRFEHSVSENVKLGDPVRDALTAFIMLKHQQST